MPVKEIMTTIARHILNTAEEISDSEINAMVKSIEKAQRIFVIGAGRSGLAARAFATRLVQLGMEVYVVGETIAPGMTRRDLLLAVSGSGETKLVVEAAKIAKSLKIPIIAVTSYPKSSLGNLSNRIVKIRGKTKVDIEKDHFKHQIEGKHSPLTPLGTLFEDTVMVFFDGIIAKLMERRGTRESDMQRRHSKIE